MTVVSMSTQEFSRLQVLLDVQSGRLRIEDAAQLIGLGSRQVFRLLTGLRDSGPSGLISKRRGCPSNRRLPPEYRDLAMALVQLPAIALFRIGRGPGNTADEVRSNWHCFFGVAI